VRSESFNSSFLRSHKEHFFEEGNHLSTDTIKLLKRVVLYSSRYFVSCGRFLTDLASTLDEPKIESKTMESKPSMESKASALDGPDLKRHYNDNIKTHQKFV
jgi:hypothetical protein